MSSNHFHVNYEVVEALCDISTSLDKVEQEELDMEDEKNGEFGVPALEWNWNEGGNEEDNPQSATSNIPFDWITQYLLPQGENKQANKRPQQVPTSQILKPLFPTYDFHHEQKKIQQKVRKQQPLVGSKKTPIVAKRKKVTPKKKKLKTRLIDVSNKFQEIEGIVYIKIPRSQEFVREVYRTRFFKYIDLQKFCRLGDYLDWLGKKKTKNLFQQKGIPIVDYSKKLLQEFSEWIHANYNLNEKRKFKDETMKDYCISLVETWKETFNPDLKLLTQKFVGQLRANVPIQDIQL